MKRQGININAGTLKDLQKSYKNFRKTAKTKYADINNLSFENYLVYLLKLGHDQVIETLQIGD